MSRVMGKDGQYLPLASEIRPDLDRYLKSQVKHHKKRGPKPKRGKLLPVGYKGQRYIITCKDEDNKEMTVGWTNNASGNPFINCINKHPDWHSPRVERMPEELITQ